MIQVWLKKNCSVTSLKINYNRKRLQIRKSARTFAVFQPSTIKADLHPNKERENVIRVKFIEFIVMGKTLKLLPDDLDLTSGSSDSYMIMIKCIQTRN